MKDARPDALFIFCPSGEGAAIMKQFQERGLKAAGIKLIGTGKDVMDDDILSSFGPDAFGTITSHHYSAAHDSPENAAFTAAFRPAVAPNMRPNSWRSAAGTACSWWPGAEGGRTPMATRCWWR